MDIFLDAASNTPVDKRVFKAMKPYLSEDFVGNSRSIHNFGIKASEIIEEERRDVAKIFETSPFNIVFTSGATESNNMVIKGLAYAELCKENKKEQRKHIICGATEHDSVINPCKQLEKLGFEVQYIRPGANGRISADTLKNHIRKDTMLICVMAVNNELGTTNEVAKIADQAYLRSIPTLVDCTQLVSYGGDCLQFKKLFPHASFFTFSSHKIYGPEGVGCLVANDNWLDLLKNNGLVVGGAQELGLRGGTMNVAGIVGMCEAVKLMSQESYKEYYENLYYYLQVRLNETFGSKCKLNAVPEHRNIISLNFSQIINSDSLAMDLAMRGIGVSAASACDSEHDETEGGFNPSHVLSALGLTEKEIRNTIRISFCKYTTKKDIDQLILQLQDIKETNEKILQLEGETNND